MASILERNAYRRKLAQAERSNRYIAQQLRAQGEVPSRSMRWAAGENRYRGPSDEELVRRAQDYARPPGAVEKLARQAGSVTPYDAMMAVMSPGKGVAGAAGRAVLPAGAGAIRGTTRKRPTYMFHGARTREHAEDIAEHGFTPQQGSGELDIQRAVSLSEDAMVSGGGFGGMSHKSTGMEGTLMKVLRGSEPAYNIRPSELVRQKVPKGAESARLGLPQGPWREAETVALRGEVDRLEPWVAGFEENVDAVVGLQKLNRLYREVYGQGRLREGAVANWDTVAEPMRESLMALQGFRGTRRDVLYEMANVLGHGSNTMPMRVRDAARVAARGEAESRNMMENFYLAHKRGEKFTDSELRMLDDIQRNASKKLTEFETSVMKYDQYPGVNKNPTSRPLGSRWKSEVAAFRYMKEEPGLAPWMAEPAPLGAISPKSLADEIFQTAAPQKQLDMINAKLAAGKKLTPYEETIQVQLATKDPF